MVNTADFSKRLQKILDYYGLSATSFAEKIDFNRSTISHLLSGRNKPSLEFVMKVLNEFPEVELYWLLNGKGSFPSEENPSNYQKEISTNEPTPSSNLFSEITETNPSHSKQIPKNENQEVDRIVIFFKNGSFKSYE